jgi:hypothetical protein
MSRSILERTLARLVHNGTSGSRRVSSIRLSRYFTVARGDDDSVGAAMSYYQSPDDCLAALEPRLEATCRAVNIQALPDALGETIAQAVPAGPDRALLQASILAALGGVLSAPAIRNGGDQTFCVQGAAPARWTAGVRTALVVGFGGYFHHLATDPDVRVLHAIDLGYDRRRHRQYAAKIDAEVDALRRADPKKHISLSARLEDTRADVSDFDLITITGSTLCNGTLDEILARRRPTATVVLQGQSAGIHPSELFDAGISWVATSLKPASVWDCCGRGDYKGTTLRRVLEGALPWIYLVPRSVPVGHA